MKLLLADENIDYRLIDRLRTENYELESIFESHRGASDPEVIKIALDTDAIILTEDKDFGELTYRLGVQNNGIILIRLSNLKISDRINTVVQVLDQHGEDLYRKFTVITSEKVRIRNLNY